MRNWSHLLDLERKRNILAKPNVPLVKPLLNTNVSLVEPTELTHQLVLVNPDIMKTNKKFVTNVINTVKLVPPSKNVTPVPVTELTNQIVSVQLILGTITTMSSVHLALMSVMIVILTETVPLVPLPEKTHQNVHVNHTISKLLFQEKKSVKFVTSDVKIAQDHSIGVIPVLLDLKEPELQNVTVQLNITTHVVLTLITIAPELEVTKLLKLIHP
jgi:hypothetical protein